MATTRLDILATLAWRNAFRNPRRSLLTLLMIAVGSWSCVTLSALARGMRYEMEKNAVRNFLGHIQIHSAGYTDDPAIDNSMAPPNDRLSAVLNSRAVKAWSERIRVPAVISSGRETLGITLLGIDPLREKHVSFIGTAVREGRYLQSVDDEGILIGRKLAELLRTDLGKRLVIMSQDSNNKIADRGFRIAGIFDAPLDATEEAFVLCGKHTIQQFLGLANDISEISIVAGDDGNIDGLAAQVSQAVPEHEVKLWTTLEPMVEAMVKIDNGFLLLWFLVVVITVSFGLVNSLFMSVLERAHEIGLVQALGVPPLGITLLVVFESAFVLFSGVLLGTTAAGATVHLLQHGIDISAFTNKAEIAGMSRIVYPMVAASDLFLANALIVILGVAGSFYPAWRTARLRPVEALAKSE